MNLTAHDFVREWQPYRSRYTVKADDSLFPDKDGQWFTRSAYLSNRLVEEAVQGEATVGYFLPRLTRILGIDIDDHTSGAAWAGDKTASALLLARYEATVNAHHGTEPTAVFASPRGLHCYWFLNQELPQRVLFELTTKRLSSITFGYRKGIEVRPTTDCALRIPNGHRQVDPWTLEPASYSPQDRPCYDTFEVLGDPHWAREVIREKRVTVKERRDRLRKLRGGRKVEAIEKQVLAGKLSLRNHGTNDTRLMLVAVYRSAGLSKDEAVARFLNLFGLTGYTGRLASPQQIERWVHWEYRKNADFIGAPQKQSPEDQPELWEEQLVATLTAKHPWAKQRTKPVERFLRSLLRWKRYQDQVLADPLEAGVWDYLYPFWRHNRQRGFYPLPRSLLEGWNDRYNEILSWLQLEGALVKAPFGYSTGFKIEKTGQWAQVCQYYRPRFGPFCGGLALV